MRMMHVKLPNFIKCLKGAAVKKEGRILPCEVVGLESYQSGKAQSARTGVLQLEIEELANLEGVERIKVNVIPRIPETVHTLVLQAFDKDGKPLHAIIDAIDILHPTLDVLIHDNPDVDDRRPNMGLQ